MPGFVGLGRLMLLCAPRLRRVGRPIITRRPCQESGLRAPYHTHHPIPSRCEHARYSRFPHISDPVHAPLNLSRRGPSQPNATPRASALALRSALLRPSSVFISVSGYVLVVPCACLCLQEKVTGKFVLRRTKDVIRGSLPPALEVVVFCRPSPRQLSVYESCIASSAGARSLLFGDDEGERGAREGEEKSDEDEEEEEEEGEEEEEEDWVEEEEGAERGARAGKKRRRQRSRRVGLQGVLPLISTLRRLCNHPDLVDGKTGCTSTAGGGSRTDNRDAEEMLDGGGLQGDGSHNGAESAFDYDGVSGSVDKENSASHVTAAAGRKGPAWKVPRASGAAVAAKVTGGVERDDKVRDTASAAATAPRYETAASGKVLVLEALLKAVRRECPGDKVWPLRCVCLEVLAGNSAPLARNLRHER